LHGELVGAPSPAGGPPPQVAQMEECEKRLALASTINYVILLVIIVLMVFKTGV
jgi:hypothetical protein